MSSTNASNANTQRNLFETGNAIYEVAFKKGGIMNRVHLVANDRNDAIAKGKKYCDNRKLKFIFACEWLVDPTSEVDAESVGPA